MKQDVFIQKLRNELGALPKAAVDEIIADYREYIGDAIAAGRAEEEVIAALGDPVKLARELKAQASYRQWESHRSFGNLARVIGAIAGLGLLNMLLLIPFMIYLSLLTAGYVLSIGLTIAGLVAVVTLGSHRIFGWPQVDALPFDMQLLSNSHAVSGSDAKEAQEDAKEARQDAEEAKQDAKEAGNDISDAASEITQSVGVPPVNASNATANDTIASASSAASTAPSSASGAATESLAPAILANLKDMKIVGDHFVFKLTGDTHLALVTTSGAIAIHPNDNGGLKIAASGSGAQDLLTIGKDNTISVARKDVMAMSLHDDESRVSLARDPSHGNRLLWDVRHGDDHVSFVQDANGDPTHIAIKSATGSVELNGQELKIDNGDDHLRFRVHPGATAAGTALIYGIAALLGGILGLLVCIWLTRVTWRALVRHAKRQVDVINARFEAESPPMN